MPAEIAPAIIAFATAEVDLAHDALADEITWTFADGTDELMARHAFEAHVAFEDLQIGGADAGEMNFDDGVLIFTSRGATASRPNDPLSSIFEVNFGDG